MALACGLSNAPLAYAQESYQKTITQTSVDNKTGTRYAMVNGQWFVLNGTAINPNTGARVGLVNGIWIPIAANPVIQDGYPGPPVVEGGVLGGLGGLCIAFGIFWIRKKSARWRIPIGMAGILGGAFANYALRIGAPTATDVLALWIALAGIGGVIGLMAGGIIRALTGTDKTPAPGAEPRNQPSQVYFQNLTVVAIRKKLAGYRCEVPACLSPEFESESGQLYVEVHHLVPLAEGGKDVLENTVALCPSHHRLMQLGKDRHKLIEEVRKLRLGA